MRRFAEAALEGWVSGDAPGPACVTGVRGCGKTSMVRGCLDAAGVRYSYFDFVADGLDGVLAGGGAKQAAAGLGKLSDGPMDEGSVLVLDGFQCSHQIRGCIDTIRALASEYRVIVIGNVAGGFGPGFGEIRMFPLSFQEYLAAMGVRDQDRKEPDEMNRLFLEFIAVGGFPSAVEEWRETGDERDVDRAVREIVSRLREDTVVEMGGSDPTWIHGIMESIPVQLSRRNKKFMYAKAARGARAKDLARPLDAMEGLGAIVRVPIYGDDGSSPGFKLFCSDTGMLRTLYGLPMGTMARPRAADEFLKGAVENAVLMELVKSGYRDVRCWRSGNRAEAELVVSDGGGDVPIQVDLSDSFYARSLREYVQRHPGSRAVYMSPSPGGSSDGLIRVPLYEASRLRGILSDGRAPSLA